MFSSIPTRLMWLVSQFMNVWQARMLHNNRKNNNKNRPKRTSDGFDMNQNILLLSKIYCIVIFLAGGVEAGNEHHLVALSGFHYLVVDHLHIV